MVAGSTVIRAEEETMLDLAEAVWGTGHPGYRSPHLETGPGLTAPSTLIAPMSWSLADQ